MTTGIATNLRSDNEGTDVVVSAFYDQLTAYRNSNQKYAEN